MGRQPTVYERFLEELDQLTIKADEWAVAVVGELTRAVKRAQMVVDGELATVATRREREADVRREREASEIDEYVAGVMEGPNLEEKR